jgi:catechol 2,3-dioxygenase-like lactoylglutathione lyase family enzyme
MSDTKAYYKRAIVMAVLITIAATATQPALTQETRSTPVNSVGLAGNRLQQIAITTSDLPRAIVFYRDVLGLPLMFETNGMAFFDVAGIRLMIAIDRKRPKSRPTSIIYFDAPNFNATVEKLRQLKLPLDGPVETVQSTAQGSLRLQQFRDPDGNALAVMGIVAEP